MLSLHTTRAKLKGKVKSKDFWPENDKVRLEYSGPEGANIYFTDIDTRTTVRIEMDAELIEALFWLYTSHNKPALPERAEWIPGECPF